MTDVLERLRAANPVPACPAPPVEEVWRRIDLAVAGGARQPVRSVLPRRWPLALPPLALAAAAVLVAVVLIAGRGPGSSIVAKAYAAVDGSHGTIRYTETSTATSTSGRAAGHRAHAVRVVVAGSRGHAIEAVVLSPRTGRVVGVWTELVDGHAATRAGPHTAAALQLLALARADAGARCEAAKGCNVTLVDPLVTLRTLYLTHQLRPAGRQNLDGRVLDAIVDTGALQRFRLLVDPKTFAPVRAVTRIFGPKNRLQAVAVTNFTNYQRLNRPLPRPLFGAGAVSLPPRVRALLHLRKSERGAPPVRVSVHVLRGARALLGRAEAARRALREHRPHALHP